MKLSNQTLYRGMAFGKSGRADWPDPFKHGFEPWSPAPFPNAEPALISLIVSHIRDGARESPLISTTTDLERARRYAAGSFGGVVFEICPAADSLILNALSRLLHWETADCFRYPQHGIDPEHVREAIEYAGRDQEMLLISIPRECVVSILPVASAIEFKSYGQA